MTSVQERLQIKREPLDKWSIREKLCLASAVVRSGDQNWMSVSRTLKPFGDANRPADWFHQKNCAAQYWSLLENVETPKRKKRTSGPDVGIETPAESILKRLRTERLAELKKLLAEEKAEYARLQEDMRLLNSGNISEEKLDKWCKEIDEEEKQKEHEAAEHSKWLKEREIRKQEIERAWRPTVKVNVNVAGIKRKTSDSGSVDSNIENEIESETTVTTPSSSSIQTPPEPGKSAQSPLLTRLLKSPSHAQSTVTSSILHTAITNQSPTTTNPTIASLLNSTTNVTVSPSLQQLVTTAIGQEPTSSQVVEEISDIPDDPENILRELKVEDIESTILASADDLPEMKDEEVEVIISDLIESAEIVTDPEEHLQLDGNVDLVDNLESELEELVKEEEEEAAKESAAQLIEAAIKQEDIKKETIDPFEFQEEEEDAVYEQPIKISQHQQQQQQQIQQPQQHQQQQQNQQQQQQEKEIEITEEKIEEFEVKHEVKEEAKETIEEPKKGSVEIVEVVVMEDEEIDKELNKTQIENIVHTTKPAESPACADATNSRQPSDEPIVDETRTDKDSCEESNPDSVETDVKDANKETAEGASIDEKPVFTPEPDDIFDIELKVEKPGKAKRDYSRTKKKEEKDFDILFSIEQSNLEEEQETCSEKEFSEIETKKDLKKLNERSNSPWTEEDDVSLKSSRRRYSTPATPSDSIPNSPGSTTTNEDDREYRNWKKSVLLAYSRLAAHKYSSLFLKPITDEQAPGYHNVIHRPMDLQTIRKNIENGSIRTTAEFQRDVLLMFQNAVMYNKTNEHVYNMACEMQQEGVQQIQLFVQAQQGGDAPARRETRTGEREPAKRKRVSERIPDEFNRGKKFKKDD